VTTVFTDPALINPGTGDMAITSSGDIVVAYTAGALVRVAADATRYGHCQH
jgi:hypothetical protein